MVFYVQSLRRICICSASPAECPCYSRFNAGVIFVSMHSESIDTAEYLILENIYSSAPQKKPVKQRELARIARTSLGMTNSILKRLTQKGWITIKKLNSRNIRYAITMDGFNEIIKRSHRYFKRTIDNITFYRDAIDEYIQKAKQNNVNTVLLIGSSDLEFILEHCCYRHGISFLKTVTEEILSVKPDIHVLVVFSESKTPQNDTDFHNSLFISDLLLKSPQIAN